MSSLKNLSKVYESAKQIPFDDSSKIVIMSDCHRGDGSWADDFSKNQNLYIHALRHYYNQGYTYIELGDGDELWKNSNLADIIDVHRDVFQLLSQFFCKGRLYFIFGNHDMIKKDINFIKRKLCFYFDESHKKKISMFENIKVYEGLVLKHKITNSKIFLLHGHQVDYFNYKLWKLARFLAKHLWKPLELFGVNNPTNAAKNYQIKESIEKKLIEWVKKENQMLIAGHTHRSMFPEAGEPPYFNDGSCVHPHGITGIEIADGYILLVKWEVKTKDDGTLFVDREILAGPRKLNQ